MKILYLLVTVMAATAIHTLAQNTRQHLIPFQSDDNKLYGYKDSLTNTEVIKACYIGATPFINGIAQVVNGDLEGYQKGLVPNLDFGFINAAGKEIFTLSCQDMRFISGGRAAFQKERKWGFVDSTGKTVVEPRYDNVGDFGAGVAVVANGSKRGLINRDGKEIIPVNFDFLDLLSYQLIVAFNGTIGQNNYPQQGKYGIFDKNGKAVQPLQFDQIAVKEGVIFVIMNEKCGLADTLTGKIIVPCEMDYIPKFYEGIACISKGGKFGYVKEGGKLIVPPVYEFAANFEGGAAPVKQAGKYGFVNKTGTLFIPCIYDYYEGPLDGMWMVEKAGKSGYVNSKGFVVPCIYDNAFYMNSIFRIQKGSKHGLLDKNGKVLAECVYDEIGYFKEQYDKSPVTGDNLVKVKKGNKYGVINGLGKLVIPVIYDDVEVKGTTFTVYHLIKVKQGELWGIANLKGELISPCEYDVIYAYQSGMCKVLKSIDGERVAGFLDSYGKLAFAGLKWYMVKDYFDGEYVEYNTGLEIVRIDKKGVYKSYKKKDADKWIELENGKKLNNTW